MNSGLIFSELPLLTVNDQKALSQARDAAENLDYWERQFSFVEAGWVNCAFQNLEIGLSAHSSGA
jgi:hypothetical protein